MLIWVTIFFLGISTHVRLLLKLIQDHNGGSPKDNDERKSHRVAGMISIIDEVKGRIQRIQSTTKMRAELRRCNTDLKPNIPRDKRSEVVIDEKERLKRELSSSFVARKSLQAMCSNLGKEKEIMAMELARKTQELTEMEDFINDLKSQNEMILEKLQAYHSQNGEESNALEMQGDADLRERNKVLEEQLQMLIEDYRFLKRKFKDIREENIEFHEGMEEMEAEIQTGIDRIRVLKEKMTSGNAEPGNIREEVSALQHMFESLSKKIFKHRQGS